MHISGSYQPAGERKEEAEVHVATIEGAVDQPVLEALVKGTLPQECFPELRPDVAVASAGNPGLCK